MIESGQADLFVAVGGPSGSSPFKAENSPAAAISKMRVDLGVERAAGKAERELGFEWVTLAAEFLSWFAIEVAKGQPFKVEDARLTAAGRGFAMPDNARAWGGAVRRAALNGFIVRGAPVLDRWGSYKAQWRAA